MFSDSSRGHGSRLSPGPPLLRSLGGGGGRTALLRSERPAQERYPGKIDINQLTHWRSFHWFLSSAGCSHDYGRLLLAVLAVLLHEPDEPPDRPRPRDQSALRHEAGVGRRRRGLRSLHLASFL